MHNVLEFPIQYYNQIGSRGLSSGSEGLNHLVHHLVLWFITWFSGSTLGYNQIGSLVHHLMVLCVNKLISTFWACGRPLPVFSNEWHEMPAIVFVHAGCLCRVESLEGLGHADCLCRVFGPALRASND